MAGQGRGLLADRAWRLVYRLAFRAMRAWWWLRRPAAPGVGVVVTDGQRILVVRHSYQPGLGIPGGGTGRGEDARSAAARELAEEVGIAVEPAELRSLETVRYVEHGRSITCTIFAVHRGDLPEPRVDGREIVWAAYLPPTALDGEQLVKGLALLLESQGAAVLSAPPEAC
jgi:8-oxo-dGTP diphosphatase